MADTAAYAKDGTTPQDEYAVRDAHLEEDSDLRR